MVTFILPIILFTQVLSAQSSSGKSHRIGIGLGYASYRNKDDLASPLTYRGWGVPVQLSYQYRGNQNVHDVLLSYGFNVRFKYDFMYYQYTGRWENHPTNYDGDLVKMNYLGNLYETVGNGNIVFGQIFPDLGYIHISTFEGEDDWILDIDEALEKFRNLRGIVVDVRHNSGGSTANSDYVASRFADRRRVHGYFKYRNGPNHDDFTELYERFVEPSEKWRFTKATAVLTNRRSYSSTETFVLAMRAFPHVVIVGDTTGGGGGNPIYRELPNGWTYRLPVWIELTHDKEVFEGIGLAPDTTVWISFADQTMGRDSILRTAMQLLHNN